MALQTEVRKCDKQVADDCEIVVTGVNKDYDGEARCTPCSFEMATGE